MLAAAALAVSIAVPVAGQQAAAPAPAQNVDPTGTWSMTFQAPQGPVPAQMIIKKDGDRFIGSIASDMGQAELEAAVKEKAVTVGFAMSGSSGDFNVVMNGTIDGDAIKGTFDAGGTTGEFTGTRAKEETKEPAKPAKDTAPPAKTDMTGTWTLQVATETISASPTVNIKQDGEKLTGQYISAQYGAFPLTGSIKDDKFELNVPMNIEGNSLAVYFGGTIDKDSVKGTVAYGDFAQGTFTGTRKK
jgi:hypothetical protein